MKKYETKDLYDDFPDDASCLNWLMNTRFPDGVVCPDCQKKTKRNFITSRKSYSCQKCGHQLYPTAGTIFHKSSTPLTLWFYVIYLMAKTQGTISAKQIEREIGVTYKTAWRMRKLIREQSDF